MSNLTSHLFQHYLKEYAAVIFEEKERNTNQDLTLPQAIDRTQPYPSGSKQALKITNTLSYFIAKEKMPFNIVERPGFKKLVSKDTKFQLGNILPKWPYQLCMQI